MVAQRASATLRLTSSRSVAEARERERKRRAGPRRVCRRGSWLRVCTVGCPSRASCDATSHKQTTFLSR